MLLLLLLPLLPLLLFLLFLLLPLVELLRLKLLLVLLLLLLLLPLLLGELEHLLVVVLVLVLMLVLMLVLALLTGQEVVPVIVGSHGVGDVGLAVRYGREDGRRRRLHRVRGRIVEPVAEHGRTRTAGAAIGEVRHGHCGRRSGGRREELVE